MPVLKQEKQAPISIIVIGSSGHGKSTLLNALAADKNAFLTAADAHSCTQDISTRTFDVRFGEGKGEALVSMILTDTPGFPDTNQSNAIPYFDKVVEACKAPKNAIIWLVKQERATHVVMSQYKVLLQQFNNAAAPIYLVVNGMECYEDDEEREEKIQNHLKVALEFGKTCEHHSGLSFQKILVSTTKGDLKKVVAQELGLCLKGTSPRPSPKIKSFEQLKKGLQSCTDNVKVLAHCKEELQNQIDKMQRDIEDEHALAASLRAWGWGTGWIPLAGQVGFVILRYNASQADGRAQELEQNKKEKQEEIKNLTLESAEKEMKTNQESLAKLEAALKGTSTKQSGYN